ncbi:MAG: sensor histidine kinase [Janthinobacterium lividum]
MGEWDKARIGQVFSNLLGNAIQYGFPGAPIRIDVAGGAVGVTLTIANDSVPIPAGKLGTIFDPLTRGRLDNTAAPSAGNLGLGLYITKEVVVAHGGTIEVSSSEAHGTVFTAFFPRPIPAPARQYPKASLINVTASRRAHLAQLWPFEATIGGGAGDRLIWRAPAKRRRHASSAIPLRPGDLELCATVFPAQLAAC